MTTDAPAQPDLAADAAWSHAMLEELSELGLGVARALERRAEAAQTPEELVECVDAFCRVARAVSLSVALDHRLEQEARAPQAGAEPGRDARVDERPRDRGALM